MGKVDTKLCDEEESEESAAEGDDRIDGNRGDEVDRRNAFVQQNIRQQGNEEKNHVIR